MEQKPKSNNPPFKWWLLTWNNPPQDWKAVLQAFKADYAIGQLEKGENGTPHIQGALYFAAGCRATSFKGMACWIKGVKVGDALNIINYCKKVSTQEEPFVEFGTCPQSVREKTNWGAAVELASKGRILEVDPQILVRYITNLQKIYALKCEPYEHPTVRGIWVHGRSKSGKSYYVRKNHRPMYIKPQNKWFDGYMGEPHILLDDFDKWGVCLGHLLKIWTDQYECKGEIKGATVQLRHTHFWITSQYYPSDFWRPDNAEDKEILEAIVRRLVFYEFVDRILTEKYVLIYDEKLNIYNKQLIP